MAAALPSLVLDRASRPDRTARTILTMTEHLGLATPWKDPLASTLRATEQLKTDRDQERYTRAALVVLPARAGVDTGRRAFVHTDPRPTVGYVGNRDGS